ncbi:MAG: diguanylate cyclase [Pseudomonadota bacterium]
MQPRPSATGQEPLDLDKIRASGELPSPTGVALEVMRLLKKKDVTLQEVARVIKADPALAGRIIKAANAAHGGGLRPIASVPDALAVTGLATVRRLALGFSLISSHSTGKCAAFDYGEFWSRSLATAIALQMLTLRTGATAAEEVFALGLLAQIGRLALATLYPEKYADLLRSWDGASLQELAALERTAFNMDHNELTAAMLADWGFPQVLIDPAHHHEAPEDGKFVDGSRTWLLAHSLFCASLLAKACLSAEQERRTMLPKLFLLGSRLGFETEAMTALMDQVVVEWQEWGKFLHVRTEALRSYADLADSMPENEPGEPSNPTAAAAQLKMLVVDDDATMLIMLKATLGKAGYTVFTAKNGREAMERVLEVQPHIVITDWMMPEMDGVAFCKELRTTKIGRGIYVLILTGLEDESRLVEAFEAGVDDYVLKPLNQRVLSARLRAGQRVIALQREVERDREEIRQFAAELAVANRRLQEAATMDFLTGLPNRRFAMGRIEQEWAMSSRSGRPLSCMLIDIDHFKQVNDTHGHDVGDAALQHVANTLKQHGRTSDVVCRLGGEEFLVICPDTDMAAAMQAAERLRQAMHADAFRNGALILPLTISIGVASRNAQTATSDVLIKEADCAVYAAKKAGRDRIMSTG